VGCGETGGKYWKRTRDEMTGGRRLCIMRIFIVCILRYINKLIKSRSVKCSGHEEFSYIIDMRKAYKILVGNLKERVCLEDEA
jgi:hypothetical protein